MELERTSLGQQEFDAHYKEPLVDLQGRDVTFTRIVQTVESETYYPRDPIAQEDFMESSLDDMYDRGLITEEEAVAIFGNWIRSRRPGVTVINIPRRIAEPFYE
jgi:hypothetical protein